jgi:hypothetical protein
VPLCRSAATDELLRTWEVENPVARQRFGELMTASGIEPPDTDLLAWGDVMGYDESRVGDRVATALEQAIEDDLLTPGARWLPPDAGSGRRYRADGAVGGRQATHAAGRRERRAPPRWARHGNARGGDERDAILEPVLPLLATAPERVSGDAARAVLHPVLWLLDQAATGIALDAPV